MVLEQKDLIAVATQTMPFGKYQGRCLIDIPEEYFLWFEKKGFPKGRLGFLMQLTLEIKVNGQEGIIQPLKQFNPDDF